MAHICEEYPCHSSPNIFFNCNYCYCPLFEIDCKKYGGNPKIKNGKTEIAKNCSKCDLPHTNKFEMILTNLKENHII